MTIRDALFLGKRHLKKRGIQNPNLDAEVLLSHILCIDRSKLFVLIDERLTQEIEKEYERLLNLRCDFVPVSYITGLREFYGLDFFVEPGVLIPRPETEFVVDKCLEFIENINSPKIADICCGSGAISVAIAVNNRHSEIFASDISDKAEKLTNKNSQYHKVKDRIEFLKGNLFYPFKKYNLNNFDVIVSNPPYIPTEKLTKLPEDVKKEPKIALDGGSDGLDFYHKIINYAPQYLKSYGGIILEIGWDQAIHVKPMLESAGFSNIEIIKDYAGFDRVISAMLINDNIAK